MINCSLILYVVWSTSESFQRSNRNFRIISLMCVIHVGQFVAIFRLNATFNWYVKYNNAGWSACLEQNPLICYNSRSEIVICMTYIRTALFTSFLTRIFTVCNTDTYLEITLCNYFLFSFSYKSRYAETLKELEDNGKTYCQNIYHCKTIIIISIKKSTFD